MKKRYVMHKDDKRKEIIRNNAVNYLKQVNLDKSVEVVIRQHRKSRTDEQRGGFHFLCETLGNRLGYTQGEIKDMVKQHVYGVHEVTVGERVYLVTESSEVNEDGEPRDTLDYGRLIDGIYNLAAEAGEVLPILDPDHYWKNRKAG